MFKKTKQKKTNKSNCLSNDRSHRRPIPIKKEKDYSEKVTVIVL